MNAFIKFEARYKANLLGHLSYFFTQDNLCVLCIFFPIDSII